MNWNVLIVDDERDQAETTKAIVASKRTLGDGKEINAVIADGFDQALKLIEYSKFDLIILDLKDEAHDGDDPNAELSGERVMEQLRQRQFTPVVFYTGFAQKVEDKSSAFVKVVRKGDDTERLREAIREVFSTNLPQLIRHIQEEQRKFLWEHVEQSSGGNHGEAAPNELAFLLGRRLANALAGKAIRRFFKPEHDESETIHPIELYIWPPMADSVGFGDILERDSEEGKRYFVVLNPACDFSQCKAEKALLAECELLTSTTEFTNAENHRKTSTEPLPKSITSALRSLLADNRQGKKVQPDRYKFLPGTSFLPDLIVDYQHLLQVPVMEIHTDGGYRRLATLDTPFAESVQSRYVRYYGRVGTPDLEWDALVSQLTK
ncbi:response regulator [Duganella sp. S19_KUP01_CR8]|uniref:response regulator n=1 Tax=Duganella sp. S19_KUP01_CR8 TaxID=3025502 RepID=UPI002FCDAD87